MATFVQKVECLVGKLDAAVGAAQFLLRSVDARIILRAGRRDRAIRSGRRSRLGRDHAI